MTLTQDSRLLRLPAELRNQVYDHIAYTDKTVSLASHGSAFHASPLPLGQVCRQMRHEFTSLLDAIPLEHASSIIVCNTNFSTLDLVRSLSRIPAAAPSVERTVVVRFQLLNAITVSDIQNFTKHFSGPTGLATPSTDYHVMFAPETDLDQQRMVFARLARQYRFHHSDGEQRVWEKIYWSFAEEAEKIDGIDRKQFTLGCWKAKEGGMRFV